MKHLRVTNIQRGCVYDGPGMRTTVFLKGCNLRCPWCCNPETQSYEEEWFVDKDKCLLNKGIKSALCINCERVNGKNPVSECAFGVAEKTSTDYDVNDLYAKLTTDNALYQCTDGGVTFSGGEPLLQSEALIVLFEKLKKEHINIAIETSLFAETYRVSHILNYVDLWIVDLKLQPMMFLNNESYINKVTNNLELLEEKSVAYRMVFVNEILDDKFLVLENLQKLGVRSIEVLLCHNLGKKKYEKLMIENSDYTGDRSKAMQFVDFLGNNGINATLLTV